jgi:branched-chain amino acid transport system ATP-binding protein
VPLLSVSGLGLTLGGQRILKRIDLTVGQGEVVGIIGPNGSGKTTFFNVLSGFLRPSNGTITFRGEEITRTSPMVRARHGMGRVFQNFGIFREMTVAENVLVAFEALPREEKAKVGDLAQAVERTLRLVHLEAHASTKASSLSGGQLRLLEIARTFAVGKQLLLLDEPTAGVSPKMTHEIAELILRLKKEGRTVLIVEHDLPFIQKICDRVVVLDVGEVALAGTPSEVRHHPKLKELYFGADPTE